MDEIKEYAYKILDISQKIYKIQEKINPKAIFKDKTFLISKEENHEVISIKKNYEKKESSYYFETSKIKGVIIKKDLNNYCVKACVNYTNVNNKNLWFAKIRIESSYNKDIQIMGKWGGSWQQPDSEDENLITNPNSDFPFALDSMKTHLEDIYNQFCKNNELNSDLYDPKWVKKLKKYN